MRWGDVVDSLLNMSYIFSLYKFIISELRIAFLSHCTFAGGLHPRLGVFTEKRDARQSRPGTAVCPDAGPGRGAAGQHQPGNARTQRYHLAH